METLNTPHEIALWTSVVAARHAYEAFPTARSSAELADAAVLELRKRLHTSKVSDPTALDDTLTDAMDDGSRVRVTFGNGEVSEGSLSRSGDMWVLDDNEYFGLDAGLDDAERAISVEILEQTPEAIDVGLNEQLRLAAERGQRVRATMADGSVAIGRVVWESDCYDNLPARIVGDPSQWCGESDEDAHWRVVRVETLA